MFNFLLINIYYYIFIKIDLNTKNIFHLDFLVINKIIFNRLT